MEYTNEFSRHSSSDSRIELDGGGRLRQCASMFVDRRRWGMIVRVVRITSNCLTVVVGPEFVELDENRYNSFSLATGKLNRKMIEKHNRNLKKKHHKPVNQVLQCDAQRIFGLHHIEHLILDVLKVDAFGSMGYDLIGDSLEEVIQRERRQIAGVLEIQNAKQIVERLRFVAILESQHKVQIRFVVHFTVVRMAFGEHTI